jgi:hypothetical protein
MSRIPVNKQFAETSVHHVGHQGAVVPANSLDTLAVHLVVCFRPGVVETSVAFLVDQQVREIHLYKDQESE